MKKLFILGIYIFLFLNLYTMPNANPINNETLKKDMKKDIFCLLMGYKEYISDIEQNIDGTVSLIMKSGSKIPYNTLQSTLKEIYPLNTINTIQADHKDPGRIRNYSLLKEVYGYSKKSVESNLTNINLAGKTIQFNCCNGAASDLRAVFKDLIILEKENPSIHKFIYPLGGTFNYRYISDSNELSPHSFGIAIDLAVNKKDYWKWATKKQGEERLDIYPSSIVTIFEKHNFIWGGKWNHFDLMHFEYRPELILKSKYFSKSNSNNETWYYNLPLEDNSIKLLVEKIENTID